MKTRKVQKIAGCVTILGLLLASCTAAVTPGAPAAPASPAATAFAPQAITPTSAPVAATASPKAAADQPKYGGILETAMEAAPADLDLLWGTSTINHQVVLNSSCNGLVQYDPLDNVKIVPRLAEKWDVTPDGKLITFYLRKGVKWHDGKPFTAGDVKATMDLWLAPPQGKMFRGQALKELTKGVEIIDDFTVKVTLKQRSATYFNCLAVGSLGTMAPKHILDAQKGVMKNTVVGTGPFKFKKWEADSVYEAERNPNYFMQGLPYLDGLRVYVIKDTSTMLAAFRTGRIKLTYRATTTITPSQVAELKKVMPGVGITGGAPACDSVYPNNGRAPWNDKRVRQAANLAVDRQAAVTVLGEGMATIGRHLPPGPYSIPEAELLQRPGWRQPKDADIAQAKKLLADAGYPNGFKTTVMYRSQAKTNEYRALFAKDQLAKIGIELQLDPKQDADALRIRSTKDFDMQALGPVADFADAMGVATYFAAGNDFAFESPKRDELVLKYDAAATEEERKKTARDFEEYMMDEAPWIPFSWRPNSILQARCQ